MKVISYAFFILLLISFTGLSAKEPIIDRLEPSCWWKGMGYDTLQLLVHGKNIENCNVAIEEQGITILNIQKVTNPNYLFLTIKIESNAQNGIYPLLFILPKEKKTVINFELKERNKSQTRYQGFSSEDAIYLLMPDRFANGDIANDNLPGMLETANRESVSGRHGGDIKGIINHLDYITNIGFTSLWINPLLENNMKEYSYHGYSITDFYKIDPRFGRNIDYVNLVDSAHIKGLKIIADMVLNHCGTNHWFVNDPPDNTWFNNWDSMTYSNFRGEVMTDPYAAGFDKMLMEKGWFAPTLADFNLSHPLLLKYMIQNTLWWIEYAGFDGIRMDTYPYPNKASMVEWAKTIKKIYPSLTIVGETWLQKTSHTAYWQSGSSNFDDYDSQIPVVTDFPLYYAIGQSMNESDSWTEGLKRLYYVLSEDFLYRNPSDLVIFADNHDLERFYTTIKEDYDKFRLSMAFLLTIRGIPQLYYGTEILMTGEKKLNDGYIRSDFPGGWKGDTINAFLEHGLNSRQEDAIDFVKTLLEWRKTSHAVHRGNIIQFIPENNTYVYFRQAADQSIMVILNKNEMALNLNTTRYREGLATFSSAKNIITGEVINKLDALIIPPMSPLILELIK